MPGRSWTPHNIARRIIFKSGWEAFTRVVRSALKVFAKNTPVEWLPNNPNLHPGVNRWWYAPGGNGIITNNASEGTVTYQKMTFSLPYPDVSVATVANNLLWLSLDGGSGWQLIYVIQLDGVSESPATQNPTSRMMHLADFDPAGTLTTYRYIKSGPGMGSLAPTNTAITIPAGYSALIPAFNADGTSYKYGFGHATDGLAKVISLTNEVASFTAPELADLQSNPSYPDNLTKDIWVAGVSQTTWDGARNYSYVTPGAEIATNRPGPDKGSFPALQTEIYDPRFPNRTYIVGSVIQPLQENGFNTGTLGYYWVAQNSGTTSSTPTSSIVFSIESDSNEYPNGNPVSPVIDGSITWVFGGYVYGTPTGAYAYTDPLTQEYSTSAYPSTLEDRMAAYTNQFYIENPNPIDRVQYPYVDITYEVVAGPTAFGNTQYLTIPHNWGVQLLGPNDIAINPLITRAVKFKRTIVKYDLNDDPTTPLYNWFYEFSFRGVKIYRYPPNPSLPSILPGSNGSLDVLGKNLIGWCLNRQTGVVEEIYDEEISGQTLSWSTTGAMPVNTQFYCWGNSPNLLQIEAEMVADSPGLPVVSDYTYESTGDIRQVKGRFIAGDFQYGYHAGAFKYFKEYGGLSGASYSGPYYNLTVVGGVTTNVKEYQSESLAVIPSLLNYQARAYGIIKWSESIWQSVGGSNRKSITQTISAMLSGTEVYSAPFVMTTNTTENYNTNPGLLKSPYISPLDANGNCIFSLYWQYRASHGTGSVTNPFINQKLFTTGGEGFSDVNFNGTIVTFASMNTVYPGNSAIPLNLEVVTDKPV